MSEKEINEILTTFKWIKIPKFKDDPELSWEFRYNKLNIHHIQETTFLIEKIREIIKEELKNEI